MSTNLTKEMPAKSVTMSLRETTAAAIARRDELIKIRAEMLQHAEEEDKTRERHLKEARAALQRKHAIIRTAQRLTDLINQ